MLEMQTIVTDVPICMSVMRVHKALVCKYS